MELKAYQVKEMFLDRSIETADLPTLKQGIAVLVAEQPPNQETQIQIQKIHHLIWQKETTSLTLATSSRTLWWTKIAAFAAIGGCILAMLFWFFPSPREHDTTPMQKISYRQPLQTESARTVPYAPPFTNSNHQESNKMPEETPPKPADPQN